MNRKIRNKKRFDFKKSKRRSYSKIGGEKSKRRSYSKIGGKKSKRRSYSKIGGKKSKRRSYSKIMNKGSNNSTYKKNKYGGGKQEILNEIYQLFGIPEDKYFLFNMVFSAYKNAISLLNWDIGKEYLNTSGTTVDEIDKCEQTSLEQCEEPCRVYKSSKEEKCLPVKTIREYKSGESIQVSIPDIPAPSRGGADLEAVKKAQQERIRRMTRGNKSASPTESSKSELFITDIWETVSPSLGVTVRIILFYYPAVDTYIMLFPFGDPMIPITPQKVTEKINQLITDKKIYFYVVIPWDLE